MATKKKEMIKQNKNLKNVLVALFGMQLMVLTMVLLGNNKKEVSQIVEDSGSTFPFWIIWVAIFVPVMIRKKKKKYPPNKMRVNYILMAALGILVLLGMLSFLLFT